MPKSSYAIYHLAFPVEIVYLNQLLLVPKGVQGMVL